MTTDQLLTPAEVEAIGASCADVTAAPWEVEPVGGGLSWDIYAGEVHLHDGYRGGFVREADAEFCARARADVPRLVATCQRLYELLGACEIHAGPCGVDVNGFCEAHERKDCPIAEARKFLEEK